LNIYNEKTIIDGVEKSDIKPEIEFCIENLNGIENSPSNIIIRIATVK